MLSIIESLDALKVGKERNGVQVTDWNLWKYFPNILTDAGIAEMQSASSPWKSLLFQGTRKIRVP